MQGPFLHDPSNSTVVDQTTTTLAQTLEAGHQYTTITVASTTGFPDSKGFLVLGLGFQYEAGPIPYLGVASPTVLFIDPAFIVPSDVPSGVVVNLAYRMSDNQVPHGDGDFWVTSAGAGREFCISDIDSIASGAREIIKTTIYPNDVGLAGYGLPTHGVQRITGVVAVWSGDDIDIEVDNARNS